MTVSSLFCSFVIKACSVTSNSLSTPDYLLALFLSGGIQVNARCAKVNDLPTDERYESMPSFCYSTDTTFTAIHMFQMLP